MIGREHDEQARGEVAADQLLETHAGGAGGRNGQRARVPYGLVWFVECGHARKIGPPWPGGNPWPEGFSY